MPLFTRENAALHGAKGRESQAREREAVREQSAMLAQALEIVRRADAEELTDYRSVRLARVRSQLDGIDALITKELEKASPDYSEVNALAGASDKLSEIERLLANRPAPRPV